MVEVKDVFGKKYVSEEDYLRVVEEKELLKESHNERIKEICKIKENNENWKKISLKTKQEFTKEINEKNKEIEGLKKELKEKDKEMEIIANEINFHNHEFRKLDKYIRNNEIKINHLLIVDTIITEVERQKSLIEKANDRVDSYKEWYNNNVSEYNKMEEKVKGLESLIEYYEKDQPQYEDYCELKYWYNDEKTGETKEFRQHMLYEDACELIGMDSDNWNEFNVVKYRREVK